jgi:hypothetical protein
LIRGLITPFEEQLAYSDGCYLGGTMPAAGYVLNISEDRRSPLLESTANEGHCAEAVPEFAHSRNLPLICFVSFERDLVTHIARGRRGNLAATKLRRLNLIDIYQLKNPIRKDDLISIVPANVRHIARDRLTQGGPLPSKTFVAVVDAFLRLSDESKHILGRYGETQRLLLDRLSPETVQSLAYQKEAVTTALGLAEIDRTPLQQWALPIDGAVPKSFLEGLPVARLREDPMVGHDLKNVPGYDFIRTFPYDAVLFESPRARLTVLMTNRLPLEEQIGTDLIYYNETYHCFVMVQYKAMEIESGNAVFRLPAKNLAEEIARMKGVLEELRKCMPEKHRNGFRFSDNPFFLKLCPRLVFNPDNAGMVPGMYIPLDYWQMIEEADDMVGPAGGKLVTFNNVGRWLDNSTFLTIVGQAWVGTTSSQSAILESLIRRSLTSGRTLALAVKVQNPVAEDPPSSDPDWLKRLRVEVAEEDDENEFTDLVHPTQSEK